MPHANRLTVGIMALVAEEEVRDVREDQGGAGGGATRLQQLADALTARGVCAPRGGEGWRPWQVRRVLMRAAG